MTGLWILPGEVIAFTVPVALSRIKEARNDLCNNSIRRSVYCDFYYSQAIKCSRKRKQMDEASAFLA
jgi:hypothetical protein